MTHELMLLHDLPETDVFKPINDRLNQFEFRWIESGEDYRMVHEPCGNQMFDVEHNDTLDVYFRMALDHTCAPRDCIWDDTCGSPGISEQSLIDHAWEKHGIREHHATRDIEENE